MPGFRFPVVTALARLCLLSLAAVACRDFTAPAPDVSDPGLRPALASATASSVGCNNEPAGYTPQSNQPWNALPPYTPSMDAFKWRRYTNNLSRIAVVTDPTAPVSPSNVMRGYFPKGLKGGTAPYNLQVSFASVTAVYTCVWHKLDPKFTNNGNTGTKFAFLVTPKYTGSVGLLNHYLNLTDKLGLNLQFTNGKLNRNLYSSWNMLNHLGTWHKFEFLVVANTTGNSDGIAKIWVDDQQVMSFNDVQYFLPGQAQKFLGLRWNPTYGGGLNPVPADMYEWVDNWYVSTR